MCHCLRSTPRIAILRRRAQPREHSQFYTALTLFRITRRCSIVVYICQINADQRENNGEIFSYRALRSKNVHILQRLCAPKDVGVNSRDPDIRCIISENVWQSTDSSTRQGINNTFKNQNNRLNFQRTCTSTAEPFRLESNCSTSSINKQMVLKYGTCVERRLASVISRFPLRPSRGGTMVSRSRMRWNTGHL